MELADVSDHGNVNKRGRPMYPLAAAEDPMLSALREGHAAKSRQAAERWSDFDAERKRLIESGTDLQKDTAAVKRLDDLHQVYKAVAGEAGDLQERLLRAIDGK